MRVKEVFEQKRRPATQTGRLLHVANGTSTTRTIEAAGIPGARSIWADPLYEGPVPGGITDQELLDVRRRYHSHPGELTWAAWGVSDPSLEPVNDMREWRATIERHESYDELILWFEHDVFDQLNLIQLLAWIREHVAASKPVSLICVGSFPGRPDFKGLGELTAPELATLLETKQRVSDQQYALAQRAWQAFRASTPEALDGIRDENTSALPYLAAAITRFLEEYPWTRDGLSRTERRLLHLADGDGITLWNAFPRMHEGERAYHVTDGTVAGLAETLARTSPPLLTLDLSNAETRVLRGRIAVTDAGRAVLSGKRDRIATCGIDRWLGGVHLHTDDRIWRWDETRQRVVAFH
jgi:hypothetical protein